MTIPLTPAACDLRDFPKMMVDVPRLFASEFNALASRSPMAWMVGHKLWYRAWHQVPAASLPDDDEQLCHLAELGFDTKTWRKVKSIALRKWVLCDDGRLYHPTVAEAALDGWIEKLLQRLSSGAGNASRYGHEFDPDPINAQIEEAAELLAALNPASRSFDKLKRRQSRKPPKPLPPGDAAVVPEVSQEKGTGTGTGTGTFKKEPSTSSAGAFDWSSALEEAKDAIGDMGDFTQPAMLHAADLKAFVLPSIGEPCTWEEVLEGIRLCAARQRKKSKPIHSWAWAKDDVMAMRDKRLNAANPNVVELQPRTQTLTDRITADQAEARRRVIGDE